MIAGDQKAIVPEKGLTQGLVKYLADLDRQLPLFIAAVLLAMFSFGQLSDPFVSHDDFDWLIGGNFDQGFETPWSKAGSEGRWLNYVWSLISTKLDTYSAFAIYLFLYTCFSALAAKVISGRTAVLSSLLIFFTPMAAELMLWPVTQITGLLIFVIAFVLMLFTREDTIKLIIMFAAVVLGFLCYPSYGPLLLLLYGASYAARTTHAVSALLIYVAAFITAVLLVFTLNFIFHGHFSIRPAPWREATPLLSTGTLQGNIARYSDYLRQVANLLPALLASAIGYTICLVYGIRSRQAITVLFFGAALLCIDAALSIISGLSLPLRSSSWLWVLICVSPLFLIYSSNHKIAGLVLTAVILTQGVAAWVSNFQSTRLVFPAMRDLGQEIVRAQTINAGRFDSVVLYGDARANTRMAALHSNRALRNFLFKSFGVYSRPCNPELCQKIHSTITRAEFVDPIIILDRKLIVVLSRDPGSSY